MSFSILAISRDASLAAIIPVGNASFETPDVFFAGSFDAPGNSPAPWQFTGGAQQVGAFDNTAPDSPNNDYITNVDGAQVAYIFPGAGNSLFQDLTAPEAKFELGKGYTFTIGAGASSALVSGTHFLQLSLYYRDGLNNKVTVASGLFNPIADPGSINYLHDFTVESAIVQAGDAWLGKSIGIEIAAPGTPAFAYWDLDKARVAAVPEPSTLLFGGMGLAAFALRRRRVRICG